MGWHQVGHPREFIELWEREGLPAPRAYQHSNGLTALVGRESLDGEELERWHVSVRYGDLGVDGRVPSWEELVDVAHELRPGIPFAIGIPPRSWWINVHPHVLHLWELRDPALIEQWRFEGRGDRPS